jgi:hypothetical protein
MSVADMALVFSDRTLPDADMEPSVSHMRCSMCKELKPCCGCEPNNCRHKHPSAFPPSCVKWRRGACKSCRATKARGAPILKRKLESARHRYGSVNSVTVAEVEQLLRACCPCPPTEAELVHWRLVKKDAELPFSTENTA